jgi:hypothetical protein
VRAAWIVSSRLLDEDQTYRIDLGPAQSSDANYHGEPVARVDVVNQEVDFVTVQVTSRPRVHRLRGFPENFFRVNHNIEPFASR